MLPKKDMKTVEYLAHLDINKYPGVYKKIKETVETLNLIKYSAKETIISKKGLKGHFLLLKELINSNADIILIRNTLYAIFFLPIIVLIKRIQGKHIIIDIPTPIRVILREILLKKISIISKIIRIIFLLISYPWVLFPAHRILQYADESAYFSFGLKHKKKLVSNGINVESIPFRNSVPEWPSNTFKMIGVATLASWHGFDRVIRGMAEYKKEQSLKFIKPLFTIVGEGDVKEEWFNLAVSLGVENMVNFVGCMIGEPLNELFNNVHVAISSLGLFRINLNKVSNLKSREYTARGIPFIMCGQDKDFETLPEFIYLVSNDNTPISIQNIIDWYSKLIIHHENFQFIRKYAEQKLSFKIKILEMIENI